MVKWFVIGVSGATCSGKTTLCRLLYRSLPWARVVCQDTYFFPEDSDKHVWVPELNHANWEMMNSLDMDSMVRDVEGILGSEPSKTDVTVSWPNLAGAVDNYYLSEKKRQKLEGFHNIPILLLDGFLLFNHPHLAKLCDLKYYFTISRDVCRERRFARTYDPPDPPGYFDQIVWPMSEKNRDEALRMTDGIKLYDSERDMQEIFNEVISQVDDALEEHYNKNLV